jgi:hypothetical protein
VTAPNPTHYKQELTIYYPAVDGKHAMQIYNSIYEAVSNVVGIACGSEWGISLQGPDEAEQEYQAWVADLEQS